MKGKKILSWAMSIAMVAAFCCVSEPVSVAAYPPPPGIKRTLIDACGFSGAVAASVESLLRYNRQKRQILRPVPLGWQILIDMKSGKWKPKNEEQITANCATARATWEAWAQGFDANFGRNLAKVTRDVSQLAMQELPAYLRTTGGPTAHLDYDFPGYYAETAGLARPQDGRGWLGGWSASNGYIDFQRCSLLHNVAARWDYLRAQPIPGPPARSGSQAALDLAYLWCRQSISWTWVRCLFKTPSLRTDWVAGAEYW
ncbi:MAG: hypothetical protein LBJ38_01860 [Oscillospiraceae bacterium]|jgi:hypothetical protein|nr:hypothetical protein [Oscillospiraceae bacterium]